MASHVAVVCQHPSAQLGVLAFLSLARAVVRGLVEEGGELGEPLAKSTELILAIGDRPRGQDATGGSAVHKAVDSNAQRTGRPQKILGSSASRRAKTLAQTSPPEC